MSRIKYPYYSPNFGVWDLIRALSVSTSKAETIISDYFRSLTGKKHILITNSCRTALFLAWKCIGDAGEVITSPLTCKVAIDPIIEADLNVVFADISLDDLNIAANSIAEKVSANTVGIQAIHLGGVPCDMDKILDLAARNNLKVIEDCAQSLGSAYKNKHTGSFGHIACFSLIKNAYGIGGGVLATDDELVYQHAAQLAISFPGPSKTLLLFRLVKNLIDAQRKNIFGQLLHKLLLTFKGKRKAYSSVNGQLKQISPIEKKIAAIQIKKFDKLHKKRKKVGKHYMEKLDKLYLQQNKIIQLEDSSFTKFFVYHPSIKSHFHLRQLKTHGIEAMHLEQRTGSPLQERLVSKEEAEHLGLPNFNKVHDHLISLPICEWFTEQDIDKTVHTLQNIISKE